MAELSPGAPPSESPSEVRLDSWKEIAAYLNRDVTTVQRWEKREGMPVHRHLHDKRGSVYALGPELDAWVQSRRPRLEDQEIEREEERAQEKEQKFGSPVENPLETGAGISVETAGHQEQKATSQSRRWLAVAGVAALAGLIVAAYFISRSRTETAGRLENHVTRRAASEKPLRRSHSGLSRRRNDRSADRATRRNPRPTRNFAHVSNALQGSAGFGA